MKALLLLISQRDSELWIFTVDEACTLQKYGLF